MLFTYKVVDSEGREKTGKIDSHSKEAAISSLQGRGYIVVSIKGEDEGGIFERKITFGGVSNKEIVVLSKQLSILFTAQVSALKIFRMLSEEAGNDILKDAMVEIASDISDGSSLTAAMAKHPKVFSSFYVNMVGAGEEAGKLSQTFSFLADYLERSYEVTSKAKSALIYPSFVMGVFVIVMYLMLTMVIPKIAEMLVNNGQELPIPTKIVIAMSNFLVNYGLFFIISLVIGGYFLLNYIKSEKGRAAFDE
jgi:type II secretory pathway component PulF